MSNNNPESLELKAGAVFEYGSRTYRLDAFLCEVEDKTPAHPFIAQLVAELNAEEDSKLPAGHRRIKLRFSHARRSHLCRWQRRMWLRGRNRRHNDCRHCAMEQPRTD